MKIKLDQGFINKVKEEVTPHWGPLGWVTYKRTYARWIDDKNRTENWDETVKRVVEGNINLDPRLHHDHVPVYVYTELNKEAKELFKLIYGLASTPSGRNLWISGTDYQNKHGDALNNCFFISASPKKYGNSAIVPYYLSKNKEAVSMPFAFLFDELMKGGGVGENVSNTKISNMPIVDRKVKCVILIGKESSSYEDSIKVGAIDRDEWLDSDHTNRVLFTTAEDSREGWVKSMALLIDAHYNYTGKHIEEAVIDLTNIRGKGEKIHGFGGVASGPTSLIESLFKVNKIINNREGNKLTSVDCTDICNLIGKCVVSGGVRRSAEIAIGDANDSDFVTMKQDKEQLMDHRWASNNSVFVDHKFTNYDDIADSIAHNGEPGIIKLDLSRNYGRMADGYQKGIDGDVNGFNPCLSGDMKLLTTGGYKRFDELSKLKNIEIINADGDTVESRVWCSGEKNTVKLILNGMNDIVCTPNHKFLTFDGEVEAKNLKGKYLVRAYGKTSGYIKCSDVVSYKKIKVYDFTEPKTHWGIVNGIVCHNCGEISLADGEPCNLFEVFPLVSEEQGWNLKEVFRLATRYAKRVTFSKYDWEITRNVVYKNRRIGISMSGIQDWILKKFGTRIVTGFEDSYDLETRETYKVPVYNKDAVKAFDNFFHYVTDADKSYSNELGCKPSIKHTTVKPSGTVSKLAGVSEGMHFHYGRYLIQRIRFQDTDPILKALKVCGYHIEKDAYSNNTMCVDFYVKATNADSNKFVSAGDVSIEEQFATQAFLQTYWADNAVSCTITFHKEEEKKIAKLFRQYRDITKSTSLLPYSGSGYVQAPKEPITKDKYFELKSKLVGNVEKTFNRMNNEKKDQEIVDQQDCASGSCPIR